MNRKKAAAVTPAETFVNADQRKAAAVTPAETFVNADQRKAAAVTPAETFVNADQRPEPPDPDTLVRVYPSPTLPEGSFLPGVGIAGADVAPELADEWLAAGLATTTPPATPADEPEV